MITEKLKPAAPIYNPFVEFRNNGEHRYASNTRDFEHFVTQRDTQASAELESRSIPTYAPK